MLQCPFLGTHFDPRSRYSYATIEAACYSVPERPHAPSLGHQEHFCLGEDFSQCVRYIEAQRGQAAAERPTQRVSGYLPGQAKPSVRAWLMLAGSALLAGVGLVLLVFLAFKFVPVAVGVVKPKGVSVVSTATFTRTPASAGIVVTATPVPTATLAPSPILLPAAVSPAPPVVPAATSTVAPAIHVVQRGETLSTIARMYGVSVDDLARVNNIVDRGTILVGQKLVLPPGAGTPLPTPVPTNTPAATPTLTVTLALAATATPTPTNTVVPTATSTSAPACNGDEAMSFSPSSPVSGDTVIISVTSAKAHTDVRLARGTASLGAPVEIVQGGKGWIWRWRIENVSATRYDFNFWVGDSPVCTTNGFTASQATATATPTNTRTPTPTATNTQTPTSTP